MVFAGKGRWTLIAMLLCLSAGLQAATLKIATLSPPGSAWMQAMEAAGVRIAAETEGRVTLRFYPGGVMGDDTAVLRKIRFGQLQGAALTTGALQNDFTDVQLYNLPMLFNDFDEVDALRAQFDPALLAGLEEAGWVAFGFAEAGFAYAMSKAEVTTLPEARALKVWSPSDDEGAEAALRGFGLTPVPLGIADVLPGLQTQLIDAIAAPPVGAERRLQRRVALRAHGAAVDHLLPRRSRRRYPLGPGFRGRRKEAQALGLQGGHGLLVIGAILRANGSEGLR